MVYSVKNLKNKKKVLVIAHDAGGSEIIGAYISKHIDTHEFVVYTNGPGENIFKKYAIPHVVLTISRDTIEREIKKNKDAEFVLLGTGWMSEFESLALEISKKEGLKTIVYLESWTDYRERFGYPSDSWEQNIPDEIWVGDKPAFEIASKNFPEITVRLVPNEYFNDIKKRYHALRNTTPPSQNILFLSDTSIDVEDIFENLLRKLSQKHDSSAVIIRFHPSDSHNRFDEIIDRYSEIVHVEKSPEQDIVRDFLRAKVVIGRETVAMAASSIAGIKTISIAGDTVLSIPFPEITRVQNAEEAVSLIYSIINAK